MRIAEGRRGARHDFWKGMGGIVLSDRVRRW